MPSPVWGWQQRGEGLELGAGHAPPVWPAGSFCGAVEPRRKDVRDRSGVGGSLEAWWSQQLRLWQLPAERQSPAVPLLWVWSWEQSGAQPGWGEPLSPEFRSPLAGTRVRRRACGLPERGLVRKFGKACILGLQSARRLVAL